LTSEKIVSRSAYGLGKHGIVNAAVQHWNLGTEALYEATVRLGLGTVTKGGALACQTGKYTGRSPNDKFILQEPNTTDSIWWGKVNKPIDQDLPDGIMGAAAVSG